MSKAAANTPLIQQYLDIKARHPDSILFFRVGDFYEMFFEDAETASAILEITLTARNRGHSTEAPMCGVPHHAARGYIDLIRGHILKEDNILFEMADQAVRGSACDRLCGGYGAVCARRFEGHSKEELQALAGSIRERAGLA